MLSPQKKIFKELVYKKKQTTKQKQEAKQEKLGHIYRFVFIIIKLKRIKKIQQSWSPFI